MAPPPTLEALRQRRRDILALAARHRIRSVAVFGSVARGEARDGSDIDLLVEAEAHCSLLDIVGFEQDLGEQLGCRVDVLTPAALHPLIAPQVEQEAVPL